LFKTRSKKNVSNLYRQVIANIIFIVVISF